MGSKYVGMVIILCRYEPLLCHKQGYLYLRRVGPKGDLSLNPLFRPLNRYLFRLHMYTTYCCYYMYTTCYYYLFLLIEVG